mmetsp:Transcript_14603/g.26979  ORF Transcript_14603/g.26979 Transcript_14603/m.26979 type:complete len:258 (-) Transcript_14603:819-1592(-)
MSFIPPTLLPTFGSLFLVLYVLWFEGCPPAASPPMLLPLTPSLLSAIFSILFCSINLAFSWTRSSTASPAAPTPPPPTGIFVGLPATSMPPPTPPPLWPMYIFSSVLNLAISLCALASKILSSTTSLVLTWSITLLALSANFKVLVVSSTALLQGLTQQITVVFVFPPKLSCNSLVSLLSLYGTCVLLLSPSAAMTFPNVERLELMFVSSFLWPLVILAFVFIFSLPAKSTKFSFARFKTLKSSPTLSASTLSCSTA